MHRDSRVSIKTIFIELVLEQTLLRSILVNILDVNLQRLLHKFKKKLVYFVILRIQLNRGKSYKANFGINANLAILAPA